MFGPLFPLVGDGRTPGGLSRAAVCRAVKGNSQHPLRRHSPGIQQLRPHQLQHFLSGLTFEEIASIIKGQHLLVLAQASPEQGGKLQPKLPHGGPLLLPFNSDPRRSDTFVT